MFPITIFSATHHPFLISVSFEEPIASSDAIRLQQLCAAMKAEIGALESNNTHSLPSLPQENKSLNANGFLTKASA